MEYKRIKSILLTPQNNRKAIRLVNQLGRALNTGGHQIANEIIITEVTRRLAEIRAGKSE